MESVLSYAEATKRKQGSLMKEIWVEADDTESRREVGVLKKCLVGSWVFAPNPPLKVKEVRDWALGAWRLRGGLKVAYLGESLILFKFEIPEEVERVLEIGQRSLRGMFLKLERWSLLVGCTMETKSNKETWIRVVGLPVHLWS